MKSIGLIFDKDSKKVFLLPEEVKTLTSKSIVVNVQQGYGACLKINDEAYAQAGAKIYFNKSDVIANSNVLLKVEAFNAKELKDMKGKIAITMANYLVNVEMIMHMLQNNVTGIEWAGLNDKNGYLIYPRLETLKGPLCIKLVKEAIARGFGKGKKAVKYPSNPKVVILNATFAGVQSAKDALASGFEVTLLDSDLDYLKDLKSSDTEFKKILANTKGKFSYADDKFETLQNKLKGANIFINTCIDPVSKNKLRVTKEMALSMERGAILLDASCETGYAFHFIKKYASKELIWEVNKDFKYLAMQNMSDLFAEQASKIISKASVNYLILVADKGIENETINKLTNIHNGQVVNETLKTKLVLY